MNVFINSINNQQNQQMTFTSGTNAFSLHPRRDIDSVVLICRKTIISQSVSLPTPPPPHAPLIMNEYIVSIYKVSFQYDHFLLAFQILEMHITVRD